MTASWLDWLLLAPIGAGVGFYLLTIAVVVAGIRTRRGGPSATTPITVLKPCWSDRPGIDESLATFCVQDHPHYQVVFGLASEDVPAARVVRELCAAHPDLDCTVVVAPPEFPENPRVSNLLNMLGAAKHDLLLVSDDDVRAPPGYLSAVAAALDDPRLGAAVSLFHSRCRGLAGALNALTINLEQLPFGLITRLFGAVVANGAALALRREALEQVGGFAIAAPRAGDNYHLVERIATAGYRTRVLDRLVEMHDDPPDVASYFRHQLRWDRTDRYLDPLLAAGRILTHGLFWALVWALVTGGRSPALAVLAGVLALRLVCAAVVAIKIGDRTMLPWLPLVPVRDLASVVIWVISWCGSTIREHEVTYRLGDGKRAAVRSRSDAR